MAPKNKVHPKICLSDDLMRQDSYINLLEEPSKQDIQGKGIYAQDIQTVPPDDFGDFGDFGD